MYIYEQENPARLFAMRNQRGSFFRGGVGAAKCLQ